MRNFNKLEARELLENPLDDALASIEVHHLRRVLRDAVAHVEQFEDRGPESVLPFVDLDPAGLAAFRRVNGLGGLVEIRLAPTLWWMDRDAACQGQIRFRLTQGDLHAMMDLDGDTLP